MPATLDSFALRRFLFGTGRIVNNAIARQSPDNGPGGGLEFVSGEALEVIDRGAIVTFEVLGQVAGIAEELVVLVETVRQSAETAETLEPGDDLRVDHIAGAVEFRLGRTLGAQLFQFLVDGFFQFFRFYSGLGGRLQLEDGAEPETLIRDRNILSDLLFVDERLKQAAGFSAPEDLR